MKQFEISINNRPGELAKVADALATNGINIVAIASERCENPIIRIVTNDELSTRNALNRTGFKFKENDLMVLELDDRPGELAKVAKKLARVGVNVESIHIFTKGSKSTNVALVVDDHKKAKEALH